MSPSPPPLPDENDLAEILDLFEEHVYAGAITPDGRYVSQRSGPKLARFLGGPRARRARGGVLGVARPPGRPGRVRPLQPATAGRRGRRGHLPPDRARRRHAAPVGPGPSPSRRRMAPCVSPASSRTSPRATRRPRGSPRRASASRGCSTSSVRTSTSCSPSRTGASRSSSRVPEPTACSAAPCRIPSMENWEDAVHPEDRVVYDAYNATVAAGEDAEAEYRLVGADGITRWVHDRARCRRRPDGAVEASGIVSDVTERRHMRAELAQAHAALSQAVEAMDAHLYTLRVEPDGSPRGGLSRAQPRGARRRRAARGRGGRSPLRVARAPRGPASSRRRTPAARYGRRRSISSTGWSAWTGASGSSPTGCAPGATPTARSTTTA